MKMKKATPTPTAETLPFWTAASEGRLVYQHCIACKKAQFPPRNRCARCGDTEIVWRESHGIGTIHSFTVTERAATPAFKEDVPYVIALVDLDEGFRMMVNVRGDERQLAAIGARVRIVFEAGEGSWPLPVAELLGKSLTFDRLEPGRVYGRHTETISQRLIDQWTALYPWDPPQGDTAPSGLTNMVAMRTYLISMHPRPAGNVHASIKIHGGYPLKIGARVSAEVSCSGKEEKRGRRFVDFRVRGVDDQDRQVINMELRLLWAQ